MEPEITVGSIVRLNSGSCEILVIEIVNDTPEGLVAIVGWRDDDDIFYAFAYPLPCLTVVR